MILLAPGIEYISFVEFVEISYNQRGWHFPNLHYNIATWLEDTVETPRRLLQAFRYAAKSELTSLYVAWRLYCNPDYTCIIVSAGIKLANRNSTYIRTTIENHPLTKHLVPETDEWKSHQFNVKRPNPGLHHSVVCTSTTSKMTGFHGDELLGDDIEVDENARTQEGRDATMSAFQEMMSMSDHHLFVGTPHSEETIYNHLQYTLGFETLKLPVWETEGVPAWPEERGIEWIKDKENSMTSVKFRSQFLLIPERSTESLIDVRLVKIFTDQMLPDPYQVTMWNAMKASAPIYYIGEDKIVDLRAYWDVASGFQGKSDSVIAAVARAITGNYYVIDLEILPSVIEANDFSRQCDAVLDFCKRNVINSVLVEKNLKPTLGNELKLRAIDRRHKIAVKDSIRTRFEHKHEFIASMIEPIVKTSRMHVTSKVWKDTPFKQQLSDFPKSKLDDCIDAVAGAIHALSPPGVNQSGQPTLHQHTVNRSPTPIGINSR